MCGSNPQKASPFHFVSLKTQGISDPKFSEKTAMHLSVIPSSVLPVQKPKENGRHLSFGVDLSVQGTSALVSSVEAILDSYMEGAEVQKDNKERNSILD